MAKKIKDILVQQVDRLLKAWDDGGKSMDNMVDRNVEAIFSTHRIVAPVINIIGDELEVVIEGIEPDRRVVFISDIISPAGEIGGSIRDQGMVIRSGFYSDLLITSDGLF